MNAKRIKAAHGVDDVKVVGAATGERQLIFAGSVVDRSRNDRGIDLLIQVVISYLERSPVVVNGCQHIFAVVGINGTAKEHWFRKVPERKIFPTQQIRVVQLDVGPIVSVVENLDIKIQEPRFLAFAYLENDLTRRSLWQFTGEIRIQHGEGVGGNGTDGELSVVTRQSWYREIDFITRRKAMVRVDKSQLTGLPRQHLYRHAVDSRAFNGLSIDARRDHHNLATTDLTACILGHRLVVKDVVSTAAGDRVAAEGIGEDKAVLPRATMELVIPDTAVQHRVTLTIVHEVLCTSAAPELDRREHARVDLDEVITIARMCNDLGYVTEELDVTKRLHRDDLACGALCGVHPLGLDDEAFIDLVYRLIAENATSAHVQV